jgi:glycosyltransferase involved in cell wall biosynthesis
MSSPLVSVLMTSYNREKYIATAIESVLASTYTNLELIIVDDRSKDSTVSIANSYADKDDRVRVYVNEQNLGDYKNRNQAASYAKGKYIKYVDADDYIYPWGLQILVETLESFKEAGWGLCSIEQNIDRPFPFQLSPAEAYAYHYEGPGLFHKAPLSAIIKKSCFDAVGGFSPIRMAGDFDMWHRLAQLYPVVLMPHGIVWYRKHSEQEMSHYQDYVRVYDKLTLQYLQKSCPLSSEKRSRILKKKRRQLWSGVLRNAAKLKFKKAWDVYQVLQIAKLNYSGNS